MKKKSKNKIIISITIIVLILLVVGVTYAYWILTKEQTNENVVNSACLNITFSGENDIKLNKAYPMADEKLEKFLSTAIPYHFTIKNECESLANVTINLESLTADTDKQLKDEYINAILYQTNYKINLFKNKKLTEKVLNDENKVLNNSLHAYELHSFTLKQNEEKEFNLLLYLDQDTPRAEENMNASWKGKITLSSNYKEDKFRNSGTLRQLSATDTNGMWGYKDKLTKIVIETKKEDKLTQEGEIKYGPFNEGIDGSDDVISYVVCDSDETCTGYLQSDGGVKANRNSIFLFNNFSKVTAIDGLENFDTTGVTYMGSMFAGMSSLETLDLSNFDTSEVTNMGYMFYNLSSMQKLDLSSFDTKNVNSTDYMFSGMQNLQELDISSFDTSHVENMNNMFYLLSSLSKLNVSNFDTSHVENMSNMFRDMSNITSLDLSGFNTSSVKDMSYMFQNVSKLQTLDLSNFDTSKVESMNRMFQHMSGLESLNLSSFNTSNVTDMSRMFDGATSLNHITFGPKFIHNVDALTEAMYNECPALERPTDVSWQSVSYD